MSEDDAKDYSTALVDGCEVHERHWWQKKKKAADCADSSRQGSRADVQRMMQTGVRKPISPPRPKPCGIVPATHQRTVQEVFSDFADNAARCGRNARNAARLSEAAAGSLNEQAEVFENAANDILRFLTQQHRAVGERDRRGAR